jgi:predicted amidohydrolase YtcJ
MKADITIYDKDIMKIPLEEIRKTWARITIVDGVVRYGKLR